MLNRIVAALVSVVLLLCTSSANAALMAYMKIRGQKSGEVKSGATQKGHENLIGVLGASHEIISPRDAASGLPAGKRQHKAFVVTKEVDRTSPILYSMLVNNEPLPEVTIQFYHQGPNGQEALFYTVTMTNASVSSIKFTQPASNKPDTMRLPESEEISFTYQKITWTVKDPAGNTEAVDDWASRT